MAAADSQRRWIVGGQMHMLPGLARDPLRTDAFKKTHRCPVVQARGRLRLPKLHVDRDGMALVGADFCMITVKAVTLLAVFPHNALERVPADAPSRAGAARKQRLYVGPAVFVERDLRRRGVVPQHKAQEPAERLVAFGLLHQNTSCVPKRRSNAR